jgi:hypothetical protein
VYVAIQNGQVKLSLFNLLLETLIIEAKGRRHGQLRTLFRAYTDWSRETVFILSTSPNINNGGA